MFILALASLLLPACSTTSRSRVSALPGQSVTKAKEEFGQFSHSVGRGAGKVKDLALRPLEQTGKSGRYRVSASPGQVSRAGLCWPLIGEVSRGHKRGHDGLDICAPEGTPIAAACDGTVVYAGNELSGYGNVVVLEHGNDVFSIYGHNSRNLVRENQRVRRGQTIALVGQTGNATTPHCHFEVRQTSNPIDPRPLLP